MTSRYGYILFKFYEMANSEKVDKITNSTNSQSAVKARDLRSNDKIVLSIKKNYEQTYPNGYMVTKRGENVDATKYDAEHIIQLTDLGKELIAWQSQRPTLSYSETKMDCGLTVIINKAETFPELLISSKNRIVKELDVLKQQYGAVEYRSE